MQHDELRGGFEERTWQAFCRTSLSQELGRTVNAIRHAKVGVLCRFKEEVGG